MKYLIDPNTIRAKGSLLGGTKYYDENGVYLGETRLTFLHVYYYDAAGRMFAKRKHDWEEEGKELFAEHGYAKRSSRRDDGYLDGLFWGMILADSWRPREPNPIFHTTRLRKK